MCEVQGRVIREYCGIRTLLRGLCAERLLKVSGMDDIRWFESFLQGDL